MKILLDENVPRQLARELAHHETSTVYDAGLAGVKNGSLLKEVAAISDAIDQCIPESIAKVYCGTFIPGEFRNPNSPSRCHSERRTQPPPIQHSRT